MDELRKWASSTYENTLEWWQQFADKVCASTEPFDQLNRLYKDFEERGPAIRRRYEKEAWMG